jgi:hypothetical protein
MAKAAHGTHPRVADTIRAVKIILCFAKAKKCALVTRKICFMLNPPKETAHPCRSSRTFLCANLGFPD